MKELVKIFRYGSKFLTLLWVFALFCKVPCYALPGFGKNPPAECPPEDPPKPPPHVENICILIPNLTAIILNGDVCYTSKSGSEYDEGVHFNQLDVCGDIAALKETLEKRFINKPFSQEDLRVLKEIIVENYVGWGYPLVDVCIPPQDVTDGKLQVAIIESKLNEIRIKGGCWFSDDCIRQYLRLEEGCPINVNAVSSDLYFINRNCFRRASIVFSPGSYPGSTDVTIATEERFPVRVYAGLDDHGNNFIGTGRGFVGFNWGNAFGLDHILTFQFTASDHFNRLKGYALAYEAPFPWQHTLYLYGGYSQVKTTQIADAFTNKGRNYQVSALYEVPLSEFSAIWNHAFQIGFDYKRTNNNLNFVDFPIFASRIDLTQLVFGYWYERETTWGDFWINADLVASPFKFLHHQNTEDFNSLRPFTKPRYIYVKGDIEIDYNLPWYYSFVTRVLFQWSNDNLLPSEEFWLGGFDTVRGYEERVIDGDSGVILNLELWTPPFSPIGWFDFECLKGLDFCEELYFLVFFDYGTTSVSHRISENERLNHYLMSVGPGVRYWIDDNVYLSADWGFQLHRVHKHSSLGNRVNFNFVLAF